MTDDWTSDSAEWADESDESEQDDLPIETEINSKISESPSNVGLTALLPEGNHLVLSGPGAGTVLFKDAAEAPSDIKILSRDDALRVDAPPIMIVHRPHQAVGVIPRLLASVVAATRGGVSLGVSAPLGSTSESIAQQWLSDHPAAALRIADPRCYLKDPTIVRLPALSNRAIGWAPYLDGEVLDVGEVLDAQRIVGANLLLTPGRALDPTDPQQSLDQAFADADTALAKLESGERLALNLTAPSQWLTSKTLREALFSQLVDQEQFDLWYIRVQWPASLRAFQQPTDGSLLAGYKRLAQLASDEERRLILPQTGLTGWLQLGFGAAGFGAGPFGAGQGFKEHSQGGNGKAPEVPRYFEPTLLHYVERGVHNALSAQPNYETCDCPYCPALLSGGDWDHELARLHGLHWLGRLAALPSITRRNASAAIRRAANAALTAAEQQPLAGISLPQHLRVWDQLL
ncbi:hypothetical protein [Mycobacteroides franklinii]|uniref:Uncharacterized protein n=1 Tax=Mycobacteroides franklinii TaxID=948102 RepID=A0A4R8R8B7_9MYCO|nr:hypothetical protein [Mycobacteroides franklinii]TDZ42384.1 hypothetical protein CCUG64054_02430 [Mycobacteroides franklinii]TDZ52532.1 hypothetical protein CCUG63697_01015 [Mycobacteroides franklinii]TDZ55939.1 hypothetical protein CCUG63696_02432 [Mycobacteroides franklinii]TDZ62880.1 hypothetical protein CCUG63695_02357 [Mycobacteroides franklinii]TDZ69277.1 hypothetical protein CCUG64056_02430 [Mycobacteroides franklinii]